MVSSSNDTLRPLIGYVSNEWIIIESHSVFLKMPTEFKYFLKQKPWLYGFVLIDFYSVVNCMLISTYNNMDITKQI